MPPPVMVTLVVSWGLLYFGSWIGRMFAVNPLP